MLAGLRVRDADVLELARLLRDTSFVDVAEKLENAYDRETKVLALTITDREAILRTLDDPPRRVSWGAASRARVAGPRGTGLAAHDPRSTTFRKAQGRLLLNHLPTALPLAVPI